MPGESVRAYAAPSRSYARPARPTPTPSTIFMVRHGDTDMNSGEGKTPLMRGWSDASLTDEGKQQAKLAGRQLAGKNVRRLFSSDLKPALDTAKIIGKELGLEVEPLPELRTWDVGKWTGEPTADIRPRLQELQEREPARPAPAGKGFAGESFDAYTRRLRQGIHYLQGVAASVSKQDGTVAAVMHGHPLRALRYVLDGRSAVPLEGVAEHGDILPVSYQGNENGLWEVGRKL